MDWSIPSVLIEGRIYKKTFLTEGLKQRSQLHVLYHGVVRLRRRAARLRAGGRRAAPLPARARLSTNDALCGELAALCGVSELSVVMDTRAAFGARSARAKTVR